MIRRHVRTLAAIAAFGVLGMGLSACTTGEPRTCVPTVSSGASSSTVTASTGFGSAPQASFPTPLLADQVQTSTLIKGDGPVVQSGDYVVSDVTILNGATGAILDASQYNGTPTTAFQLDKVAIGGLADGLACQTAGSRVAVTIPASVAFPDGNGPAGLTDNTALVVVMDIAKSIVARAHGTINASQSGFPSVVRAVDGQPGITWNGSEAPTEFGVSTLISGDSDQTVAEGDSVLVQYTGVIWNEKEPFDSSWTKNGPTTLVASPDQVVPGFAKAIIGQKVGSQVVAVLPPSEGYGDKATQTIPAGSTLVFVIDILAIN